MGPWVCWHEGSHRCLQSKGPTVGLKCREGHGEELGWAQRKGRSCRSRADSEGWGSSAGPITVCAAPSLSPILTPKLLLPALLHTKLLSSKLLGKIPLSITVKKDKMQEKQQQQQKSQPTPVLLRASKLPCAAKELLGPSTANHSAQLHLCCPPAGRCQHRLLVSEGCIKGNRSTGKEQSIVHPFL